MLLCVDAGHGGRDGGCTNGQYYEKDFTLLFARMLRDELNKRKTNIDVILTRDSDNYVTLENRATIANNNNCQLFISIHINAGSTTASGIETLVYTMNGDTGRLANNIQSELISRTGAVDRGVKIRQDLYVLKHTKMPAVLIECGFIVADIVKLLDANYQAKLITAIADGILTTVGGVSLVEPEKSSIEILADNKIITNVEYWENAQKCVKYLKELLDNMSNYVLKLK